MKEKSENSGISKDYMMTFFLTLRSFGAATQSENFAAYAAGGK